MIIVKSYKPRNKGQLKDASTTYEKNDAIALTTNAPSR
jgi:hypothetical protein